MKNKATLYFERFMLFLLFIIVLTFCSNKCHAQIGETRQGILNNLVHNNISSYETRDLYTGDSCIMYSLNSELIIFNLKGDTCSDITIVSDKNNSTLYSTLIKNFYTCSNIPVSSEIKYNKDYCIYKLYKER